MCTLLTAFSEQTPCFPSEAPPWFKLGRAGLGGKTLKGGGVFTGKVSSEEQVFLLWVGALSGCSAAYPIYIVLWQGVLYVSDVCSAVTLRISSVLGAQFLLRGHRESG